MPLQVIIKLNVVVLICNCLICESVSIYYVKRAGCMRIICENDKLILGLGLGLDC